MDIYSNGRSIYVSDFVPYITITGIKIDCLLKKFFFYQARTMSGEHNSISDDYKILQHIFFSLNESTCSICIFIGHAAN